MQRRGGAGRLPAAISVLTLAALAVPVASTAIPTARFSDVPADHAFAEEIGWIAATGIAAGYDDGSFRPGQPVTRQSMSAFMVRLFALQEDLAHASGTAGFSPATSDVWVDLPGASVEVAVPLGIDGQLDARFSASSQCGPGIGGGTWCAARLLVSEDGGPFVEMTPTSGATFVFDRSVNGETSQGTRSMERFADAAAGSTYTVKVQLYRWAYAAFTVDDWTLAAETDLFAPAL